MSLFFLLLGCSDKDDSPATDDSTPVITDDSSADDTDNPDDTGEVNPFKDAPVVQSCDAFCYLHQTGDQFYNWRVECQATDPQGLDNIWNGTVDVTQGTTVKANEIVACDASGYCSGTFREDLYGIMCSQATSYTFTVAVTDWDGHTSKPLAVTGRQQ